MSSMYQVIEDYSTKYTHYLTLVADELVKVGERFTEDPDWPGWIWCENRRGEKGWVLERVLKIDSDNAIVLEDYCAKELDVIKGELMEGLKSEAGWLWCKNVNNEPGWVPLKNVKQIGD